MRAYEVRSQLGDEYAAVIADNANEAKKFAKNHEVFEDVEWIEIRVNLKKDPCELNGISKGVVEPREGLLRGFYGYVYDDECDICGEYPKMLVNVIGGKLACSECEEKSADSGNYEGGIKGLPKESGDK